MAFARRRFPECPPGKNKWLRKRSQRTAVAPRPTGGKRCRPRQTIIACTRMIRKSRSNIVCGRSNRPRRLLRSGCGVKQQCPSDSNTRRSSPRCEGLDESSLYDLGMMALPFCLTMSCWSNNPGCALRAIRNISRRGPPAAGAAGGRGLTGRPLWTALADQAVLMTSAKAWATRTALPWLSPATHMRPVPTR